MENYQNIENVLSNMDNNIVYKRKNSIWPGIIVILAGIAFFFPTVIHKWPHGSVWPLLLQVAGSIAFIIGVFMLFLRKEYFVSASKHQKLKVFEIYFDISESETLTQLCMTGNLNNIDKLKRSNVGGGLKLVVMSTHDRILCFSQVIRFVMFEYVPQTQTIQHSKEEADILHSLR